MVISNVQVMYPNIQKPSHLKQLVRRHLFLLDFQLHSVRMGQPISKEELKALLLNFTQRKVI
jgi:hypothetical protein